MPGFEASRNRNLPLPTRVAAALVAALLPAVLPGAQAETSLPSAEIHQLDADFEVRDGMQVRIENPYGNVRIREVPLAADGQLRVTVQTPAGQPNPLRIQSKRTAEPDRVVLGVESLERAAEGRPEGLLRADFVIALPDRAAVDVAMERGDFTMHPATYPVRLRAAHARVQVSTTGTVDVEVPSGHVIYHAAAAGRVAGGRIQTSSAPVDVRRADIGRVNYQTLSGAAVTTDSLAILSARRREGREEHFIGEPSNAVLEIQTDTGPIRLVGEGMR